MAQEFYGYFDSVSGDERDYNEADLSRGFRVMCDSGVATLEDDNLLVAPADSGLRTRIGYGGAMVYGFPYVLMDDGGEPKILDHSLVVSYPRIDRVVLRLDLDSGARNITLAVVEGEEAPSPVAPELTRTGTIYEISLSRCRVNPGATLFAEADITDEREDPVVCGNIRQASLDAVNAVKAAAAAQQAVVNLSNRVTPIPFGGTGATTAAAARANLGVRLLSGSVSVSGTAHTQANVTITFPPGTFVFTPVVVATDILINLALSDKSAGTSGTTTTQSTISMQRTNTGTWFASWIASSIG